MGIDDTFSIIETEIYENEKYLVACNLIISLLKDESVNWSVDAFVKMLDLTRDCPPCKERSGFRAITPSFLELAKRLEDDFPTSRNAIADALIEWIDSYIDCNTVENDELGLVVGLYQKVIDRFPEGFPYSRWVSIFSGYSKRVFDLGIKKRSPGLLALSAEAKKRQLQILKESDLPSYWKRNFLIGEAKMQLAELMLEIYISDRESFATYLNEGLAVLGDADRELSEGGTRRTLAQCTELRKRFSAEQAKNQTGH